MDRITISLSNNGNSLGYLNRMIHIQKSDIKQSFWTLNQFLAPSRYVKFIKFFKIKEKTRFLELQSFRPKKKNRNTFLLYGLLNPKPTDVGFIIASARSIDAWNFEKCLFFNVVGKFCPCYCKIMFNLFPTGLRLLWM